MRKIRKGDLVSVLAGKDKGRTGKVLRVIAEGGRVVVEGINLHKHHVKANNSDRQGGIISKEAPLHISNVALVNPASGKPVRVGFTIAVDADGKQHKVRTVHKTGEILDQI
jgi:large subunit ribosomal protein L24